MCETAQRARKKIARTFREKVFPSAKSDQFKALGRPSGIFPGHGVAGAEPFRSRPLDSTGNSRPDSSGGA